MCAHPRTHAYTQTHMHTDKHTQPLGEQYAQWAADLNKETHMHTHAHTQNNTYTTATYRTLHTLSLNKATLNRISNHKTHTATYSLTSLRGISNPNRVEEDRRRN